MCERPKKSWSAQKWPYCGPFAGVKRRRKKKKSWIKKQQLVVLVITRTPCQIVPGLSNGIPIIVCHPCPLPRRNPRVLNTFVLKRNFKQILKKIPKYSQNILTFEPIILRNTGRIIFFYINGLYLWDRGSIMILIIGYEIVHA